MAINSATCPSVSFRGSPSGRVSSRMRQKASRISVYPHASSSDGAKVTVPWLARTSAVVRPQPALGAHGRRAEERAVGQPVGDVTVPRRHEAALVQAPADVADRLPEFPFAHATPRRLATAPRRQPRGLGLPARFYPGPP